MCVIDYGCFVYGMIEYVVIVECLRYRRVGVYSGLWVIWRGVVKIYG